MFRHTIALNMARTGGGLYSRCDTAPCSQTQVITKSFVPFTLQVQSSQMFRTSMSNVLRFNQYVHIRRKQLNVFAFTIISSY